MSNHLPSLDAAHVLPVTGWRRNGRLIEMLLIFFVLPGVLIVFRTHLRMMVMPLVMVGGLVLGNILAKAKDFDRRAFLSFRSLGRSLPRILLVFLPPACLLTAGVYWFDRGAFLGFPMTHFKFWLLVMFFYPLVGATLQEVIFRGFFFHRYERLFADSWVFLLVNASSFAMFHLFYVNPVAPTLSFFGGLLFAYRYRQTRSLFAVAFEHGLWGGFLFTVGLGPFFWSGAIN